MKLGKGAGSVAREASLVVLTGAGVSAESGLPTFRGMGGFWQGFRVEEVASPVAFEQMPERVHEFYNMRRAQLQAAAIQPNPAHLALARLEREWKGRLLLVTQNVDDLHERAGSRSWVHMHGELLRVFCSHCARSSESSIEWKQDLSTSTECPRCHQRGGMRPDVVWFGEVPYHMDRILQALATCDLFMAIGTSGHVYPAAGFVSVARQAGARTLEFNLEPSANQQDFDASIPGPASETVPAWVEETLEG